MAKKGKDAPGLTAKAPERVRNGERGKKQAKANKAPTYAQLNDQQSQVINNINRADVGLSDYNLGQMPGVFDAYSQPFDQSQLPTSPWAQGQTIEDMNTEYYDKALGNYDRSMQDQYKQQDQEFEQSMLNRGIPLGSNLYNKLKAETAKTRDSARQNAMDSAYFNAGQNATTFNNLATNNFQNAYGFQQDMRNMPASEYAKIQGLQSGMPGQNLGFNQAWQLQQDQNKQARWMMKNQPQGGGGGGGGGGAGALWQQYGFASPMDYDAYKVNQARENQQWEWQNNPQYQRPQQASPWASAAGQIGGIAAGSYLSSLWP